MRRILCAALWYDDHNIYPHQPKNIDSGMVVCGRRHHNCFVTLAKAFPESEKSNIKQGFITSDDMFVNRYEAMEIALEAKQTIKLREHQQLFSEDLY